jgi:hypothetical protein
MNLDRNGKLRGHVHEDSVRGTDMILLVYTMWEYPISEKACLHLPGE